MSDPAPAKAAQPSKPAFVPLVDLAAVREKLKRAESRPGQMGRVWRYVRRLAQEQPDVNPWFVPFVAAVTEDAALLARAKAAIAAYLDEAQDRGSSGYLFNIWCFAFPHARWAIWFDLLRQQGAYTPEEAAAEAARFILIQHRDHHAGLLVKPYPECVDNQAASLVLSSLVIGTLFADAPGGGHLAHFMREEAASRLEAMLGGMPTSGYSGEGSTYQGLIVAFAAPFLVELLERLRGEPVFDTPLKPNGTSPRAILQATERLWMPTGLLLPWDDYGYQFGIRAPLAYLAKRTGDSRYLAMLEHVANWSRLNCDSAGWGHDEPVWTLIYWPEVDAVPPMIWHPWAEESVGGTLCSTSGHRYLMQMWDPTESMCVRQHVNPNSLVISVDGIPLTADGAPVSDGEPLAYEGAVFERTFGAGWSQRMNLSKGCGGSHGGILVDGWEGFRPTGDYEPSKLDGFDARHATVTGDVTGLYRQAYPDCRQVRRRSRLVDSEFWIVEDLASFGEEHEFTCRWWFRPQAAVADRGIDLVVPEGAGLQLRAIVGPNEATVTPIQGYPRVPDGSSCRVDFTSRGRTAHWLWLLWPVNVRTIVREYRGEWQAIPSAREIPCADLDFRKSHPLAPGTLPWLESDSFPVVEIWAYRRTIEAPATDADWGLRLPRGLCTDAELWIDGTPVAIPGSDAYLDHLPVFVACPPELRGKPQIEVTLRLQLLVGHRPKEQAWSHPDGDVAVWIDKLSGPLLRSCRYMDGILSLMTSDGYTRSIIHQPLVRIES